MPLKFHQLMMIKRLKTLGQENLPRSRLKRKMLSKRKRLLKKKLMRTKRKRHWIRKRKQSKSNRSKS